MMAHIDKVIAVLVEHCKPIDYETDATRDGCTILKGYADTDRYIIDFADGFTDPAQGWQQFDTDQDAHYFGVWVNRDKLMTITYAEGDWMILTAPNEEAYNREIARMCEFYGEGFIAKSVSRGGYVNIYRQDRSTF